MQVAAAQAAPENVRAFIQEYFDAWKAPMKTRFSPAIRMMS